MTLTLELPEELMSSLQAVASKKKIDVQSFAKLEIERGVDREMKRGTWESWREMQDLFSKSGVTLSDEEFERLKDEHFMEKYGMEIAK